MNKKRRIKKVPKRGLIIFIVIVSFVLYLAGVFSGIFANNLIEKTVNSEISEIRNTIDNSALDLKGVQLQQLFMDNFQAKDQCKFLDLQITQLYPQLKFYWDILPTRLEEYDKKTKLSDEYISLKREYIRLSLRFWLISTKNYNECNNHDFIPILYFYTKDCENCLEQGEEFDRFNQEMSEENKTVIIFPIDADFKEDTVFLLKQYYEIDSYPATVVDNRLIQDRVLTSKDLKLILKVN
jgi:hypothetical protein